jgi:hypothetical protein
MNRLTPAMLTAALDAYVRLMRTHYSLTDDTIWKALSGAAKIALEKQFDPDGGRFDRILRHHTQGAVPTPNGPRCPKCGGAILLCKCVEEN